MMIDVLDPRVERMPAISTAIYPAPTMTLRLNKDTRIGYFIRFKNKVILVRKTVSLNSLK